MTDTALDTIELAPAGRGQSDLEQQFSQPLVILMTIVALVLFIACVNIANLTARQTKLLCASASAAHGGATHCFPAEASRQPCSGTVNGWSDSKENTGGQGKDGRKTENANVEREIQRDNTLGMVIGLAIALLLARVISNQLYGITAHDPAAITSAIVLMMVVGLVAGYFPALRASRLDPMVALRID